MRGDRLAITPPSPRIVALGSYDRTTGAISLTLGRFSCGDKMKWCRFNGSEIKDEFLPAKPLTLIIKHVPLTLDTANLRAFRVTGEAVETPLKQPESIIHGKLTVVDGVARLPLQNFRDGDVYHIAIGN